MSAEQDTRALLALADARKARDLLNDAQRVEHEARLRFMRNALAAGWPWKRIGEGLGITDRGAARYWSDHHMEVGRLAW